MKYIFIINSKAGKGKSVKLISNIEKACKEQDIIYEIRYITEELSGAKIAEEYKDEENIIYVVGGDGTITKTLSGIVGTNNKLRIIPAGSGNDTYKAIKKLPNGETKIDLGKINDTYFINVACTGIDAEVGNNVELFKNTIIPTSQIYTASVLYTFFTFKFKRAKIKMNVKEIDSKYSILSVCNGSYYGGGYYISPKSTLTDGVLEIYYAEKMMKLKMLPLLLKLKKGKHVGKEKVHKYRAKDIEISLDQEIVFNVDGERLKGKDFKISILPKAISFWKDEDLVEKIKGEDNYTYKEKVSS